MSSVSTGFTEQIMSVLRIICYSGSVVTWTAVSLATAKFKPNIFRVWLRLVQYREPDRSHDSVWHLLDACMSTWVLSLILRPTVSRSICCGIKHPSGAYDQIFITPWQLRFCFCGAPSLTRGRVCLLYMLLSLASAVLLGSEFLHVDSAGVLII
jgi:hypothetical protein